MNLSKDDVEFINHQSRENQVHQYFDNIVPNDYKVGDYLIRKIMDTDDWSYHTKGKWRTVKVSPDSKANKKFKVVHIDQYGVPYCKHIKINGKLGGIICMASMNFAESRFEPDPEHMDHIILDSDEEFDPLILHKASKEDKK